MHSTGLFMVISRPVQCVDALALMALLQAWGYHEATLLSLWDTEDNIILLLEHDRE